MRLNVAKPTAWIVKFSGDSTDAAFVILANERSRIAQLQAWHPDCGMSYYKDGVGFDSSKLLVWDKATGMGRRLDGHQLIHGSTVRISSIDLILMQSVGECSSNGS